MPDRGHELVSAFWRRFGHPPKWVGEAAGRVNLIGEHTDYNEGFVLPVAIDRTTLVAAGPSAHSLSRVWAIDLRDEADFDAREPDRVRDPSWVNYVVGAAWALVRAGFPPGQVDMAVQSTVPMGAGLSSSAALEVATTAVLASAAGAALPPRDLALLAHRAESEFVGVPCGVMDQFVSALAQPDTALLIDCRSLQLQWEPLELTRQGLALVVVDSAVRRRLADSAYKERREQCQQAARLLERFLSKPIRALRDVSAVELDSVGSDLPPVLLKRARHVITENARVLRCVEALRQRRLDELGALLAESHRSLRDDYQVSCPELDLLVRLAWNTRGVVGARLTGAGFGGCTVNLVHADAVGTFAREVVEEYRRRAGKPATMHVCRAAGGVSLTTL